MKGRRHPSTLHCALAKPIPFSLTSSNYFSLSRQQIPHLSTQTIFTMSDFQSLSEDSLTILGVLSLLAPDRAPESIFAVNLPDIIDLPAHLQFCTDEFQYVVLSHLSFSHLAW